MIDVLRQPRNVYRYVALKGFHNLVPAVSVIVTAQYGLLAGAAVLSFQLVIGAMVDLTFFHALTTHNGGQKPPGGDKDSPDYH